MASRTAMAPSAHTTATAMGPKRRRVAGFTAPPSISSIAMAIAADAATTRSPSTSPQSAAPTTPTASHPLRGTSVHNDERADFLERLLAEHAARAELVHARERLFLASRNDLCGRRGADSGQLLQLRRR